MTDYTRRDFMKVAGGSLTAFALAGCRTSKKGSGNRQEYELRNVKESTIGNDYERPSGLSLGGGNTGPLSRRSLAGYLTNNSAQVFNERPTFEPDSSGNLKFRTPPKAKKKNPDGTEEVLVEFSDTYLNDFVEGLLSYTDDSGNNFTRPRGLLLGLALGSDGSAYLTTTGSPNRIFRISSVPNWTTEAYKEDDELAVTSDITSASDGSLYMAQPVIYEPFEISETETGHRIVRPRRVLSFDPEDPLRNLVTEFSLPSPEKSPSYLWRIRSENQKYGGLEYQILDQIRLKENSPEGKNANGIDMYVTDLIENNIYGVSKDADGNFGDAFLFQKTKKPLLHLAPDSLGNLIGLTAPLINPETRIIEHPPELVKYLPDGAEEGTLHTFDKTSMQDAFANETLFPQEFTLDGKNYEIPRVFTGYMMLEETDTDWTVYTLFSHPGELRKVTAQKV